MTSWNIIFLYGYDRNWFSVRVWISSFFLPVEEFKGRKISEEQQVAVEKSHAQQTEWAAEEQHPSRVKTAHMQETHWKQHSVPEIQSLLEGWGFKASEEIPFPILGLLSLKTGWLIGPQFLWAISWSTLEIVEFISRRSTDRRSKLPAFVSRQEVEGEGGHIGNSPALCLAMVSLPICLLTWVCVTPICLLKLRTQHYKTNERKEPRSTPNSKNALRKHK